MPTPERALPSERPQDAVATRSAASSVVPRLIPGEDYEVDEKQRTVAVTEEGVAKVEKALDIDNLYKDSNGGLVNHFIQALREDPALRVIPALIVSVVADAPESALVGAEDRLSKPVNREALLAALRRHLPRGGKAS